jgi:hypothetical protein
MTRFCIIKWDRQIMQEIKILNPTKNPTEIYGDNNGENLLTKIPYIIPEQNTSMSNITIYENWWNIVKLMLFIYQLLL